MLNFAFGSSTLGGRPLSTNAAVAYNVVVNGADITNIITSKSVRISDTLESRSTCKFTIRDDTKSLRFSPGESVYVIWNGARLFGGVIDTVDESSPDTDKALFISINAVDFASLADRYIVTNRYENMTLRAIVEDIVNGQTLLYQDGVTISDVQDGPTIATSSFNYEKASDCFRDLAKTTGMTWNISPYRTLMFFDIATYPAPFVIGDSNKLYRDIQYKRSMASYRNRQFLKAGRDKTDFIYEFLRGVSAVAEGTTGSPVAPSERNRTFNLQYDLAELADTGTSAPLNLWVVRINGSGTRTTQRVGIRGVDEDGDLNITDYKQWFIEYGSREISQNSYDDETNNPTLKPDERIEVQYRGYFPIIKDVEDYDEIQRRRAVEGGSGQYQAADDDQTVDGGDLATEKATRLLSIYGRIPNEIQYETDITGLAPGQLQTCTLSIHGLAATQFLIDEVRYEIMREHYNPILRCRVKALDGERQDGWSDYYRKQWQAGRKFTIRENEKIQISKTSAEIITVADQITESVHDGVTLQLWTEDPFTWALVGMFQESGYAYPEPGCLCGRSQIGKPYGS